MRLALLALVAAVCAHAAIPASARAAEGKAPVVLSLVYPISTNKNPDVSTGFELSVFHGRIGSLHGLGVNGAVSLVGRDVKGVQWNGLYSQVGGEARGIQATGLVNYVEGKVGALQIAGLANVDRADFGGFQYAWLFNLVGGGLSGFQGSSLVNIAERGGKGAQFSGFANSSGGDFGGVQLASGFNFVSGRSTGLQLAGVNMAVEAQGVQIGLANFGRRSTGLQLGVFNSGGDQSGVPVGMVNLANDGSVEWIAYGSNLSAFNIGVKTSIRRFYSMLTAGLPDVQGDVSKALILTWNYGYAIPVNQKTSLGIDAGFAHYIPEKVDDPNENDRLHFALQGRALIERTLSPKWRGFVGAGIAQIYSEYSDAATSETEPLFFGGLAIH